MAENPLPSVQVTSTVPQFESQPAEVLPVAGTPTVPQKLEEDDNAPDPTVARIKKEIQTSGGVNKRALKVLSETLKWEDQQKNPIGVDIVNGVVNGFPSLVNNTKNLVASVPDSVLGTELKETLPDIPLDRTTGISGKVSQGISSFAYALLLGRIGGIAPASKVGRLARDTTIAFVDTEDATSKYQQLTQDLPSGVAADVAEYMKDHGKDENWLLERSKSALLNVVTDFGTEAIFKGSMKLFRLMKNPKVNPNELKAAREDLAVAVEKFNEGEASLVNVTEDTYREVLKTNGYQPADIEKAMVGLKAEAEGTGMSLNDLMAKKLRGVTKTIPNGTELPAPAELKSLPSAPIEASSGPVAKQIEGELLEDAGEEITGEVTKVSRGNLLPAGKTEKPYLPEWGFPESAPKAAPKGLLPPPEVLYQKTAEGAVKGSTRFLDDGSAVITIHQSADLATYIHEMGHIIRQDLQGDALSRIEKAVGVTGGNWTREAEEAYATALEKKIVTGKAPTPELDAALGNVERAIARTYKAVRDSASGNTVNKQVSEFMDAKADEVLSTPVVTVKPEDKAKIVEAVVESLDGKTDLTDSLRARGINPMNLTGSEDALKVIEQTAKIVDDAMPDIRSKMTLGQQKALGETYFSRTAEELGMTLETLTAATKATAGRTEDLTALAIQSRINLMTGAEMIFKAAEKAKELGTVEAKLDLMNKRELWEGLIASYQQAKGDIGRALGGFRAKVGAIDKATQLERLSSLGGNSSIDRFIEDVLTVQATGAGIKGLRRVTQQKNRWWRMATELRIGMLLSGVSSATADVLGNGYKTITTPFERMLAGGISGNMLAVREAASSYAAMKSVFWDSIKLANASFKTGESILDRSIENPLSHAWAASTFNLQGTVYGKALDTIGNIIRFPNRFRQASDEFFKQINYRAFIRARATREGITKGLNGEELGVYVQQALENSVDELGRGMNSEALNAAREATFSTPMGEWGRKLAAGIDHYPIGTLVVPFKKTPANIFKDIIGHTPGIGLVLDEQREAWRAGGAQRAMVESKWALGTFLYSAAGFLAYEGMLTGGGDDRATAKAHQLEGWQPYSIAITGSDGKKKYYAYNRLDPVGSFLGLAADIAEALPHMNEKEQAKAYQVVLAAITKNVSSKTYLKGVFDLLDTVYDSNPTKWGKLTGSMATSTFLPSGMKPVKNMMDPVDREAYDFFDSVRAKLPYFSEALPPSRNLFGEPVSARDSAFIPYGLTPIAFSEGVSDKVKQEMAALGKGFDLPSPTEYGVDFRSYKNSKGQDAQDRRLELAGQVKIGGKDLKGNLEKLINAPQYQRLVDAGEAGMPSRIAAVRKVLMAHREAANEQTLREYPELRKRLSQARIAPATELMKALAGFNR